MDINLRVKKCSGQLLWPLRCSSASYLAFQFRAGSNWYWFSWVHVR